MTSSKDKKLLNICIITQFFPGTSVGGLQRYLDGLIKELQKNRNTRIYVLTVAFDKEGIERKGNLVIIRKKFMNIYEKKDPVENSKKLFRFLNRLIRRYNIDIISAENFFAPVSDLIAVNMISFDNNIPLALRMHSFSFLDNELKKESVRNFLWDKLIPVSKSMTETVYNLGVPIKKLSTIYPGVDTESFRPGLGKKWLRSRLSIDEDSIVILHASRIVAEGKDLLEEKGINTLLKAVSTIIPVKKNVKVLIAAAKPPLPLKEKFNESIKKIYDIAKVYNIENNIIVQPFELDEMPFVYNGSDIFVLASKNEGFGLCYAEASSCGLPVIGTSVGGVPEIITNGKEGYLVEPDNPVELAKRIGFLINNEERRKEFGENGRKTVLHKFNLNKQVKNLLGVYNSLIKR